MYYILKELVNKAIRQLENNEHDMTKETLNDLLEELNYWESVLGVEDTDELLEGSKFYHLIAPKGKDA